MQCNCWGVFSPHIEVERLLDAAPPPPNNQPGDPGKSSSVSAYLICSAWQISWWQTATTCFGGYKHSSLSKPTMGVRVFHPGNLDSLSLAGCICSVGWNMDRTLGLDWYMPFITGATPDDTPISSCWSLSGAMGHGCISRGDPLMDTGAKLCRCMMYVFARYPLPSS